VIGLCPCTASGLMSAIVKPASNLDLYHDGTPWSVQGSVCPADVWYCENGATVEKRIRNRTCKATGASLTHTQQMMPLRGVYPHPFIRRAILFPCTDLPIRFTRHGSAALQEDSPATQDFPNMCGIVLPVSLLSNCSPQAIARCLPISPSSLVKHLVNNSVDPFPLLTLLRVRSDVTLALADPHVLYFNPISPYHLVGQADLIGQL
jgi:hypothetical protein